MILSCPACNASNRIPSKPKTRIRCGKCKREFTPADLVKAVPEPKPRRSLEDFTLEQEVDGPPLFACNDAENCGWVGNDDETDEGRCPECGKRVRKVTE